MPLEPRLLSAAAIRALEASLRDRITGEVNFGTGSRALYATDASNYRQMPIGVVVPQTTEDVIETVRTCREYGAAILPRGAGTSLAGQCCNVAVVIDMSRHLRAVVSIDPAGKTARVQPGLVLDDLQQAVKPYGLMYGPDPATHAWCTLGGMIGNNSCGVHSVVAGLTADVVEDLEVLTADGVRLQGRPNVARGSGCVGSRTGAARRDLCRPSCVARSTCGRDSVSLSADSATRLRLQPGRAAARTRLQPRARSSSDPKARASPCSRPRFV